MTGVLVRGVAFALLASVVIGCATATAAPSNQALLAKLVLRPAQIGSGYRLVQRPDGHGAAGYVTLDMCGYSFISEAMRTDRLQVNYVRAGTALKFSNEVVTYRPGGTRLALQELNDAVDHCPKGPVGSTVQGAPRATYVITRLSTAGLLPGALSLRLHISGTYKGKQFSETDTAVYQVHGNVLSGLYAYGGTTPTREEAALRVARQSAKNLKS